jgi:hypothetical protein
VHIVRDANSTIGLKATVSGVHEAHSG